MADSKGLVASLAFKPGHVKDLTHFLRHHPDVDPVVTATEALASVPRKQYEELWQKVHVRLVELTEAGTHCSEDESKELTVALGHLRATSDLVMAFLTAADRLTVTPTWLTRTLVGLHDVLLQLHTEEGLKLRNAISLVCELYFEQNRPHKEVVSGHVLMYLIHKCVDEGAKKTDMKRVYQMRNALTAFDFDDASRY